MNQVLHPQLDLQKTMVHIPDIKAGGAVVWLCDSECPVILSNSPDHASADYHSSSNPRC